MQLGVARALREQVGAGAGDDQFADQVDQLVELVGVDADRSWPSCALALLDLLLLVQRRLDDRAAAPRRCSTRMLRRSAAAASAGSAACDAQRASSSCAVTLPQRDQDLAQARRPPRAARSIRSM